MKSRTSLVVGLLLASSLAASAHAQVRYVNAARPSDGDGTSWATGFKSLQSALTTAGTYTEVWVAAGVYTPAPTDRNATFTLRNNLSILGGFSGVETAAAQRDPAANISILSGDLLGNDPSTGDNSFRVVTASGTNATAVLDGFTVRAGFSGQPIPFNSGTPGPGLTCVNGSPSISRCIFRDNAVGPAGSSSGCSGGVGSGNSGGNGGAAYISGSSPVFRQCSFIHNSAASGSSGLYCTFGGSGGAGGFGGAVYSSTSSPTFINCFFAGNFAGSGGLGGGTSSGGGSTGGPGGSGGAIAFDGAGAYILTLLNCAFSGNRAGLGGGGGTATGFGNGGNGGNAGSGGAIAATASASSSIHIINSTFSQGLAGAGGSGGNPGGGASGVGMNGASGRGGAISNGASSLSLSNSILWGNTDGTGSGAGSQVFPTTGAVTASYSDIEGGLAGTGNINADPRFTSATGPDATAGTADDDLSLQSASPCIDAANNTALLAPPTSTTDIAGKPRTVDIPTVPDTGVGPAPVADMGAYERQFCAADFNTSGSVTIQDIFDFLAAWFALDPRSDFNGVNGIGIQDIFDFLGAWFAGC